MSVEEVTRNDIETDSLIDGWLRRLQDDIDETNAMFNIGLAVKKRWSE